MATTRVLSAQQMVLLVRGSPSECCQRRYSTAGVQELVLTIHAISFLIMPDVAYAGTIQFPDDAAEVLAVADIYQNFDKLQQKLSFMRHLKYNVPKQESGFALGLDAAKITNYIKKRFNQKLVNIKFFTKKSVDAHVYLPQEWSWGLR